MRAVVALGLARHVVLSSASDLSVRSTLAGFQKFTDEMVAKYAQTPTATAAPSEDDNVDNSQDTVTQVAGAGGVDHEEGVTDNDKAAILEAITWLEGLQTDTLLPAHRDDDALQAECQERLDICEQPAPANSDACDSGGTCVGNGGGVAALKFATGSHTDMRVGGLRHAEIGSELSQGTSTEPDQASRTASSFTLGHARDVLHPGASASFQCGWNTIDRSDETALQNLPADDTVTTSPKGAAPVYVSSSSSDVITHFIQGADPAHFDVSGNQLTDGIGVFSGYFGNGAPWSHAMTSQTERESCSYMKDLTSGAAATALSAAEDNVVVTTGSITGKQEFDYNHGPHDCCTCGSLYTAKTEFGLRHKACREFHQKPACAAQKTACNEYDTCRNSNQAESNYPGCSAFPTCASGTATGGDLGDAYISVEWWFKERTTMETCLESVQKWFDPLWDKYIICDDRIKNCAEATLTCDNIQKEFELKHCQWDTARKEACDWHKECYELEITRCATTCDLIQKRVTGRKAENEIIERIICMLKALLANNDEHFDAGADKGHDGSVNETGNLDNSMASGGTGSYALDDAQNRGSDAGTKDSRLRDCKAMTVDNNGYNIVCQGPKLRRCAEEVIDGVTHGVGSFQVGDSVSHYRVWDRKQGGEYPRLPMDMNINMNALWENTIKVDTSDWVGDSSEKVGNGQGQTVVPHHRRDGLYTPWGFDCDFQSRPCTHEFVQEHYDFLRTDATGDMERAPCERCATDFQETVAIPSHDVCSVTANEVSCACFVSRDAQFCTECVDAGLCGTCSSYCAARNSDAAGVAFTAAEVPDLFPETTHTLQWQTDAELPVGLAADEACDPAASTVATQCMTGLTCVNGPNGYECK